MLIKSSYFVSCGITVLLEYASLSEISDNFVIENWYAEVYEPVFETTGEEEEPLVAEVELEEDEYGQ